MILFVNRKTLLLVRNSSSNFYVYVKSWSTYLSPCVLSYHIQYQKHVLIYSHSLELKTQISFISHPFFIVSLSLFFFLWLSLKYNYYNRRYCYDYYKYYHSLIIVILQKIMMIITINMMIMNILNVMKITIIQVIMQMKKKNPYLNKRNTNCCCLIGSRE